MERTESSRGSFVEVVKFLPESVLNEYAAIWAAENLDHMQKKFEGVEPIAEDQIIDKERDFLRALLGTSIIDEDTADPLEAEMKREQYLWKELMWKLIDQGELFTACINGEVVAMVIARRHNIPGRNEVWNGEFLELEKAITLPRYRKKGIYRRLREHVLHDLKKKHPGLPVVSATLREGVKTMNIQAGWTEIGIENYWRMHNLGEAKIHDLSPRYIKKGYTAFILKPDL